MFLTMLGLLVLLGSVLFTLWGVPTVLRLTLRESYAALAHGRMSRGVLGNMALAVLWLLILALALV